MGMVHAKVIYAESTGVGCGNIQRDPKSCENPKGNHTMVVIGSMRRDGDQEKDCERPDPNSFTEVYCFVAADWNNKFSDESMCHERAERRKLLLSIEANKKQPTQQPPARTTLNPHQSTRYHPYHTLNRNPNQNQPTGANLPSSCSDLGVQTNKHPEGSDRLHWLADICAQARNSPMHKGG